MRKYHRWLSVLFGVFLLFIATTGVMSQFAALVANGGFEKEERGPPKVSPPTKAAQNALLHDEDGAALAPAAVAAPAVAAPFVCPEDMNCRPKPKKDDARAWVGYLHHLHSGEEFGPAGVVISIISGIAMMFFAFSGLWMYVRMWANRKSRGLGGTFWK